MMQIQVEEIEMGMDVVLNYKNGLNQTLSIRGTVQSISPEMLLLTFGRSVNDTRAIAKVSINKVICMTITDCDLGV